MKAETRFVAQYYNEKKERWMDYSVVDCPDYASRNYSWIKGLFKSVRLIRRKTHIKETVIESHETKT